MRCDRLIDQRKVAKFLFIAETEGNDFSCFIISKENKRKFFLWLFLSFSLKFRSQVFLYFRDVSGTPSSSALNLMEVLIWALERT